MKMALFKTNKNGGRTKVMAIAEKQKTDEP